LLISVVIPALNEEKGIKKTISSIPVSKLHELGYKLELIVIDGNSTDSTTDVAKQMSAKVVIEKCKGYGRAYKTGLAAARGDIIVTLDADGTYPAELIPEYIQQLNENGVTFITINRFKEAETGATNFMNRFGNWVLTTTMRLLYSIDIRDSQSGMWIMKREFIDTINLKSDDMSMSEEIKIIAFKFFRSIELDGKYRKRIGKEKLQAFKHGWGNFKYLFEYKTLLDSAIKPQGALIPNIRQEKKIDYE
jgi:glycosyltransferase involved in cell wall biosynthesis